MEEYRVKSNLLHAAIWGGTGCYQWGGYTSADNGKYGRALIEYFAARLFSIYRIPGYEPYYAYESQFGHMCKFGQISKEEFDEAYRDFEELYNFTQKELRKQGLVINGKVTLNRSLRRFETEVILPQLLNDEKYIEYPANIVTSYAHDGKLYEYNSWMSIIREVPVELIIMYNTCLYHPSNVCAYQIHGGESEVWVVEKNVFGYTKLPKECFRYGCVPKKDMVDARNKQDEFSYNKVAKCKRGSLCSSTLYPVLPCKRNWLINALVSRQAKKIEKSRQKLRTE